MQTTYCVGLKELCSTFTQNVYVSVAATSASMVSVMLLLQQYTTHIEKYARVNASVSRDICWWHQNHKNATMACFYEAIIVNALLAQNAECPHC